MDFMKTIDKIYAVIGTIIFVGLLVLGCVDGGAFYIALFICIPLIVILAVIYKNFK